MTVTELIEKLKEFPQDMETYIYNFEYDEPEEIESIQIRKVAPGERQPHFQSRYYNNPKARDALIIGAPDAS